MISFDPMDPFGWIYRQQPLPQMSQPLHLDPLSQPEEEGALSRLGSKVMGGLGYVGSVLDKTFGGRALRGLLGGKPRELLSILPGSDTLGLTDEQDRVSGKELLGLQQEDGWGSTLAGMGTEMLLDPATYLTFGAGALSKGGQAAKAAGVLPKTARGRVGTTLADLTSTSSYGNLAQVAKQNQAIEAAMQGMGSTTAEHLGENLGGVLGLRVPFTHQVLPLGGTGTLDALSSLGGGVDSLLSHTPLVGGVYRGAKAGLDAAGRMGRSLFDASVLGATSHMGQAAASQRTQALQPLLSGWARDVADWGEQLRSAGLGGSGADLRSLLEGVGHGTVPPELAAVGNQVRQRLDSTLRQLQGMGYDVRSLDDLVDFYGKQSLGYNPRSFSLPGGGNQTFPGGKTPLSEKDLLAREELFKHLPGGSQSINEMGWDPMISGSQRQAGTPLAAAQHIREKYLGLNNPLDTARPETFLDRRQQLLQQQRLLGLTDEAKAELAWLNERFQQGEGLADWFHGLDPSVAASAGGTDPWRLIGRHPLEDVLNYGRRTSQLEAAGGAAHDLIASQVVPNAAGMAGPGNLGNALEAANLKGPQAQQYLLQRLQAQGLPVQGLADLDQLSVPEEVLKELGRFARTTQLPENVGQLRGGLDYLTNLTKAGQTLPWPGFHVRNWISGLWQNAQQGGLEGLAGAQAPAKALLAGQSVPGANLIPGLTHLTEEEASRALGRELFAHAGMDMGGQGLHQVGGGRFAGRAAQSDLEGLMGHIPGYGEHTVGGALSELGGSWDPRQLLGSESMGEFAPFKAGREMGDMVEGVNRGSLYIQLRRQGFSPEEAGRMVVESHFNYTPMGKSTFEREVMSRLIPYYSYMRGNVPYQLSQLAKYPGGAGSQLMRLAGDLRQQEGFLPDYLGQGLAVPVGEEQAGTRRYLTRTDLPPEQAFEMLKGGPHSTRDTLLGLIGQTNPLFKAPLEYAFGKQAFTGRDIEDLYSQTGSPGLDAILMNSPISRVLTSLRTVTDPRKYADPTALLTNIGTGLKLSDVEMEKQRQVAGRELVQEFLRGQPEIGKFQEIYVRPGMEGMLTPEEVQLLRLNKTLEQRALQQAQQRKQGR